MSVAVAAPVSVHRSVGANETDLLEVLIASCQKHTSNPALPGFGRDLEPYFALNENLPETDAKKASKTKQTAKRAVKNTVKIIDQKPGPKKVNEKGSQPIFITPTPKQTGGGHSPYDSPKNGPAKKRHANVEKKNQPRSASPSTRPVQRSISPSSLSTWAGPGFCVPPNADQLPMPSSYLLD